MKLGEREMEKLPINDVKEVVVFICRLGKGINASLKDGEFTLADTFNFSDSLLALPAAVSGIGNVIPQLKDLDAKELQELKILLIEELSGFLNIKENWYKIAEQALIIAQSFFNILASLKSMKS